MWSCAGQLCQPGGRNREPQLPTARLWNLAVLCSGAAFCRMLVSIPDLRPLDGANGFLNQLFPWANPGCAGSWRHSTAFVSPRSLSATPAAHTEPSTHVLTACPGWAPNTASQHGTEGGGPSPLCPQHETQGWEAGMCLTWMRSAGGCLRESGPLQGAAR